MKIDKSKANVHAILNPFRFIIRAHIPGMNLKDVKLSVKGKVLTIGKSFIVF